MSGFYGDNFKVSTSNPNYKNNAREDILARNAGICVSKSNTCNGTGPQSDNIFTVNGLVRVLELYGICTEATNSVVFSNCYLDLYDGTSNYEITDLDAPTDCSGIGVGGSFVKNGTSSSVAGTFLNAAAGGVVAYGNIPFFTWKKTGATTTIRFNFTGSAATDVDMEFVCRYEPLGTGASITSA